MFDSYSLRQLIQEHGQTCSLLINSNGAYNSDTGSVTTTTATYTVRAYFYDYEPNMVDGSSIQVGDRRVVLSRYDALGVAIPEPSSGDQISGAGDKVNIVSVKKVVSNGVVMCYLLQTRE